MYSMPNPVYFIAGAKRRCDKWYQSFSCFAAILSHLGRNVKEGAQRDSLLFISHYSSLRPSFSSLRREISVPFSSAPIMSVAALIYSHTSRAIAVPMEPYSRE